MTIATAQKPTIQTLARERLSVYGELVHGWKAQRHHLEWIEALEDESIKRLLIIAPPASAKTEWVGIIYSDWKVGKNPNKHLGYITHADLVSFGRSTAVRDIMMTSRYQTVFPGIEPDEGKGWSQSHWYVKRKDVGDPHPTFRACGLGSAIIAFRFDELICDDLCTQGNTQTQAERDKSWAWWQSTLLTRLTPDGRVVYIGTRWHEDDLPGHIMGQKGWKVIHIPALDENEKSYWPEEWPTERLLAVKSEDEMGSDAFNCQYQGMPVAPGGNIFRWFKEYTELPELRATVQFWDTAFSAKQQADYSACTTWGYGKDGLIYCLGAYQERLDFPDLCRKVLSLYGEYKQDGVRPYAFIEERASGPSVAQEIARQSMVPLTLVAHRGNEDKVARANSVVGLFENEKVRFPKKHSVWKETLITQLKGFPRLKKDDLVDSTVGAIIQIKDRIGRPPLKPRPLRLP